MEHRISLIVAMSENRVIGKDNRMPWENKPIPGDLKRFQQVTQGHPIIMGTRTYESIGRLLSKRTNIFVTRDIDTFFTSHPELDSGSRENSHGFLVKPGMTTIAVSQSIDGAIALAKRAPGNNEIFVIGGGKIFAQTITLADKLYLTLIHQHIEGDVMFPKYADIFTREVFREDHEADGYRYSFLELEK